MSASFSAVVLTKNEEKNIKKCLQGLSWCNEILVIDDLSIDKTVKIARNLKAKVYSKALNNDFARQRNFGLKKAKNKWVIFIDADEIVSPKLAKEIQKKVQQKEIKGFYLKRSDFLFGRQLKYGENGKIKLLRLAQRNAGTWQRQIHETWKIKGKTGSLNEPLIHHPHPTVAEFLDHLNFHSSLHAIENTKEGKNPSILKVIFYPFAKFLNNYFLKKGFLDGDAGFLAALFMSWHSFLAWSKAWNKN